MNIKRHTREELENMPVDDLQVVQLQESILDHQSSPWTKPANIIAILALISSIFLGVSNLDLYQRNNSKQQDIVNLEVQVKDQKETINEFKPTGKFVLYTQYSGIFSDELKAKYQSAVSSIEGYDIRIPGYERVKNFKGSDIRYSYSEDKQLSIAIKEEIQRMLSDHGCPQTIEMESLEDWPENKKNGKGIIEVWLDLDSCKG